MDQGGELYKNPKVRKIFEKRGFAVYPTGTDASHQNGPVERAHCTVAKDMRSFLLSSSVPIKILALCIQTLSMNDQCYAISW